MERALTEALSATGGTVVHRPALFATRSDERTLRGPADQGPADGPTNLGTVIVMTSGKGGVGKTTSSAALGAALASFGDTVGMVDFDVGVPKLELVIGAERQVVYDVIDVIEGRARLTQAMVEAKEVPGLRLLAAGSKRRKDALTEEGVAKLMAEMRARFRWVICDSPAGIENGAMMAMSEADVAIIVVNPEVPSIQDSDRIIGLVDAETQRAKRGDEVTKHLLITRYDEVRAARGQMMTTDAILRALDVPIIGVVPESPDILEASNLGRPVTFLRPNGIAGKAYFAAARKLRGEAEGRRRGLLARLFRRT
jgi:septum site-determining protein MinD